MANEARNSNMGGVSPAMMSHVDYIGVPTVTVLSADGQPVSSQKELMIAQNPGWMEHIKQAASKNPWIARAMIGAGSVAFLVPNAAAFNTTVITNAVGDLLDGFTPLAPKAQGFMEAWTDPAILGVFLLLVFAVLFAFRDKVENWAKRL